MIKCQDVMTANPTCCIPTDTVAKAAQMMKTENVGLLPVVESWNSKILVGVISDRDLVMKVLTDGGEKQVMLVEAIMTPNPISCYNDDEVNTVLQAMSEHQVRRIPIVNHQREVVGIIAQADIATRIQQPQNTAHVVKEISKPTDHIESRPPA